MRAALLVLLCAASGESRKLLVGAPSGPSLLDLSSPPGCDGPGAQPSDCRRSFLASTPVALSGQGPPLFHLPDQGKHLFVWLFAGVLVLLLCCLCCFQHAHVFLALLLVKLCVLLGCCCAPRLVAWAEAQTAHSDTMAEQSPLLPEKSQSQPLKTL